MSRALLIRSDKHPYHVTSRCSESEFFQLPLPIVWNIMIEELGHVHRKHNFAIHAFLLMGNHFHLLCHTPHSNLDEVMHVFLRRTSLRINHLSRKHGPLWDGRYKWSLIDNRTYYYQVYRYIYQNPVRAKLTSRVEEWKFSSLRSSLPFPLHCSIPFSFCGEEGELIWLNEAYGPDDLNLIRLGLRRSQFDVNKKKLRSFTKLSIPY